MKTKQIRQEMENLGIQFESEESPYPLDSEVSKFTALQALMRGWVMSMIQEGEIQWTPSSPRLAGPNDDFLKDWLDEASEEWLVG
jgi:hypothetical protein